MRPRLLTRDFVLLMLGQLLQATGFTSMLLLPLYLDWLGASRAEVGAVMAVSAVGGLAARPAIAWSLDVWGRKPTLLVGTSLLALAFMGIGLVDRVGPWLYVVRIGIGVGTGTLFAGYFTLASDIVPSSRRTEGLALFGIAGLLPLVINPFADGLGIEGPDFRWFFPGVGLLIASSLLVLAAVRAPTPAGGREPLVLARVFEALRAPRLWPVWWATTVFASLVAVFMAFMTVTADARGLADPAMGWLTYAGGAITVRLLGASLPERVGLSRILLPSLGLYVGAMAVVAWATSPQAFMVAGLMAGIGHGYSFPVLMAQAVTRTPDQLRGSAASLFTALWDLAKLLVVPAAGWLADVHGDGAMFLAVSAAGAVGMVGWLGLEATVGRA